MFYVPPAQASSTTTLPERNYGLLSHSLARCDASAPLNTNALASRKSASPSLPSVISISERHLSGATLEGLAEEEHLH